MKVTCYDGKHHPVDSSEMAFKTAASHGFKEALARPDRSCSSRSASSSSPCPRRARATSWATSTRKRGRIQGSASIGNGEVEIVATVPTSELLRYAIDLRSMTHGRGRFRATHSHYDPVPAHIADRITASVGV